MLRSLFQSRAVLCSLAIFILATPFSRLQASDNSSPSSPQDVITYAAELMGIAPPPEEPFETAEMSAMARSFYASSARVSNAKLKHELGVTLAYPTYRAALDALWRDGEGR